MIRHHVRFGIISLCPTHFVSASSSRAASDRWDQNFEEARLTGILPGVAQDHHFRLHIFAYMRKLEHDFGIL